MIVGKNISTCSKQSEAFSCFRGHWHQSEQLTQVLFPYFQLSVNTNSIYKVARIAALCKHMETMVGPV